MISAWASANNLVLGQVQVDEGSNPNPRDHQTPRAIRSGYDSCLLDTAQPPGFDFARELHYNPGRYSGGAARAVGLQRRDTAYEAV